VRGISAYTQGRMKEAEALFLLSRDELRLIVDEPLLASILQNLGACRQMAGDFSTAVLFYDSAYVMLPQQQTWLLRNNIASLHNELGNYDDALFHVEAIIEAQPDDEYVFTLALLNAVSAHTSLNQIDESEKYFLQLVKRDLLPGMEMKCLNILFKYALVADEQEWFFVLSEKHKSVILDDADWEENMEHFVYVAYLYLTGRVEESRYLGDLLVSDVLTQYEIYTRSALDESLRMKYDSLLNEQRILRKAVRIFTVLIVLIFIAFISRRIYLNISQKRALRKLDGRLSNAQDIQLIKASLAKGSQGLKALEALLRIDARLIKHQSKQLSNIPLERLNEREKEVLQLISAGKSVPDIAMSLDVSTKYVYNIRSSIKSKCSVQHNTTLEAWLQQFDDK
jgi:DNA-binding NarL/FixJ family response regulator